MPTDGHEKWLKRRARRKGPDDPYTALTPAMLEALRTEKNRTGLGAHALARLPGFPDGVSAPMLNNWLAGHTASLDPAHYQAVLEFYRTQTSALAPQRRPLKTTAGRIEITPAMRVVLREAHQRAPTGYLKRAPGGYSAVKLAHVLSGRDKTMPKAVWEFVCRYLESGAPGVPVDRP